MSKNITCWINNLVIRKLENSVCFVCLKEIPCEENSYRVNIYEFIGVKYKILSPISQIATRMILIVEKRSGSNQGEWKVDKCVILEYSIIHWVQQKELSWPIIWRAGERIILNVSISNLISPSCSKTVILKPQEWEPDHWSNIDLTICYLESYSWRSKY